MDKLINGTSWNTDITLNPVDKFITGYTGWAISEGFTGDAIEKELKAIYTICEKASNPKGEAPINSASADTKTKKAKGQK